MHLGQLQDPCVKPGRGNVKSLRVDVDCDAGTDKPWISDRKGPELVTSERMYRYTLDNLISNLIARWRGFFFKASPVGSVRPNGTRGRRS